MKKVITLFALLLLCTGMYADVWKYTATAISAKYTNVYGNWTDWSDWEYCNILVVINTNTSRINIYSKETQEYDIIGVDDEYIDNTGGTNYPFECVDAEGKRCGIRLRIQSNGQEQLYVGYSDFMLVYNIDPK